MESPAWRERLVAAIEENDVGHARRCIARIPGAEWRDEVTGDRALFWALTGAHEIGHNEVLRCQVRADEVETAISGVLARFQTRGIPCTWWVSPGTRPTNIGDALLAAGFTFRGEGPGMARGLDALPTQDAVPGLEIERVRDAARMAEWLRVSSLDEPNPQPIPPSEIELACQIFLTPDPPTDCSSVGGMGGQSRPAATLACAARRPEPPSRPSPGCKRRPKHDGAASARRSPWRQCGPHARMTLTRRCSWPLPSVSESTSGSDSRRSAASTHIAGHQR